MGIFGYNYNKDGPGVNKDYREKRRLFLFFDTYGRKFGKLVIANIVYCLLILPALIGYILTGTELRQIGILILALGTLIFGPATAAFSYILRNYATEKHIDLISDFARNFKANYKQGLILGILDVIVPVILYIAFNYYIAMGTIFSFLMAAIVLIISAIFAMINFYAYPMMATFELSFMQIIKNSLFFAIAKFPINLFIFAIDVAIVYLVSGINAYIAVLIIMPFLLFSTIGFITVFTVWKYIDESMMQKDETEEESVFLDR